MIRELTGGDDTDGVDNDDDRMFDIDLVLFSNIWLGYAYIFIEIVIKWLWSATRLIFNRLSIVNRIIVSATTVREEKKTINKYYV